VADIAFENQTYSMSSDLSGSIVQLRNQIAVAVDEFRSVIGRTYDTLNCVHPHGVLVVGVIRKLKSRQRASFNQFRRSLHGLTVITYEPTTSCCCA